MRIILALDEHGYSADAIAQMARLGENTWADITMLCTVHKLMDGDAIVKSYLKDFLKFVDRDISPYSQTAPGSAGNNGIQKKIITKVSRDNPVKAILDQADIDNADLIAMGCNTKDEYTWKNNGDVPLKVARAAKCSVLVMKKDKKINKVLCCLDHDNISQESLEMVNQMVTLFDAGLDIVVLTKDDVVKENIEKKLAWLINYYSARKIFPCIELVELRHLEAFVARRARWGLMAMWMGKKSILERVFSGNKLSRLLKANESSVLLLR